MKFHCFFEQSGTFKNEFKKLGFEARVPLLLRGQATQQKMNSEVIKL